MNLVSTVFEISFSPEFERGAIRVRDASRAGRVGMTGDEEPIPDVSRRDALKKIGIGAGIAWSAPVVLSFYNAAGAATGTPDNSTTTVETAPPFHPECTGAVCNEYDPGCSSTNADCICVSTPDPSVSFCVPGATRCDVGPLCAPDSQLPPGDVLRGQHLLPPFGRSLQRVHALLGRRGLHP